MGEPEPVAAPAVGLGEVAVEGMEGAGPAVEGLVADEGLDGGEGARGEALDVAGLEGFGEVEGVEGEGAGFEAHGGHSVSSARRSRRRTSQMVSS